MERKFQLQCESWGSTFDNLMSPYKQEKYYREHFNYTEPQEITIGKTCSLIDHGSERVASNKSHFIYYIQLNKTIKALFQKKTFRDLLESTQAPHDDDTLMDFEDGQLSKNHPIFKDKHNLRVVLYFDDVELCNPLGSKSGTHKLGLFYFTILNIPPMYRSKLPSIFLIAVAYTRDIKKFGIDTVLLPIVNDLNNLSSTGIEVEFDQSKQTIKGGLVAIVADTLAAHQILGLKEGVGFSRQKCRSCMCSFEDMNTKFSEDQFMLRDITTHEIQCQDISETSASTGINRRSVMLDVNDFDIFTGTPQDLMHILLEGCLPYTIREVLQHFIDLKVITLDQINESIQNFDYSYIDMPTKPSLLTKVHLIGSGKLRQSASQMWTLARLLPLFLYSHVNMNDPVWICFQTLLQINSCLFSTSITKQAVALLRLQIAHHLHQFKQCFPNKNIIPKQHYLLHIPSSILQLGPNVQYWTMRFEAKHGYFKKLANIANYKNVAKYMAVRHQKNFCMQLLEDDYLSNDVQHGPVSSVSQLLSDQILHKIPATRIENLMCTTWLTQNGQKYKKDCFVQVGNDNDLPIFGKIISILKSHNSYLFWVECYATCGIEESLNAYVVKSQHKFELANPENILYFEPQSVYVAAQCLVLPIKTNMH
ncbi:uncharacterized protein LOC144745800 [Ciona intestinalis]